MIYGLDRSTSELGKKNNIQLYFYLFRFDFHS
jgi:hypothetical protein